MSRELIESIISNNMLEANDMVEAKMAEIRERKMYEMKRMYAARMDEIFGALTKADIEARRKAGYVEAHKKLSDPRDKARKSPKVNPDAKIIKHKVSEEALDEAGLGDAAKAAHALKKDPQKAAQFRAAMKLRRIGLIPKQEPKDRPKSNSTSDDPYEGKGNAPHTMLKRGIHNIKKKIADHKPEAPGSGVIKAAKRVADAPVWKDLQDIGFRNI
jgi:hypothetical protein